MSAQDFLKGYDSFSSKADSYIYMNDGTEVVGKVKGIKRKKGLIEYVKLKVDGETQKLLASDVSHMYLKPSGLEKFSRGLEDAFDMTELEKDRTINEGFVKEGYVLFETVKVMIKKTERTLLMQLVNPGFSNNIRVYYDPFASETMGASVGGMKLAGGDAKSYYVKAGDKMAFKLKKKNYEDELKSLYGDCSVADGFDGKMKWTSFAKHIVHYSTKCK